MQNIKNNLRINIFKVDENINEKLDKDFIDDAIMIINVNINRTLRTLLWRNIKDNIDYAKYKK